MGADVEFELKGFDELQRKLEEAPYEIAHQALREGLTDGAEVLREGLADRVRRGWHHWARLKRGTRHSEGTEPAARAPVFGFLHEHEAMRVSVETDDLAGVAKVGPAKQGFWARFLEFGTRHMPAYAFMRPTLEEKSEAVIEAFRTAVNRALGRLK